MAKMSTAIIINGTEPVNAVCLDQATASQWLKNFDGTTVIPDPEDDFGTDFITLTGCIAVNVTGLDPMPGVGTGWTYVKGAWIVPVVLEPEEITDETE